MPKPNALKNWRTVAQVSKQCGVTPQAIRDAIKAGKIEAHSVGEYLLIHQDQGPLFEKTRLRKIRQVGDGKYKMVSLPAHGHRKIVSVET